MTLTTWVARFVVDNGRVTEEGKRLRSFQRRRLDEPDADLHVLHEPNGEKAEELGTQALDAIGRSFLNDRLSLTGGLTRALRETHATLLDWNRRSLPRDQVGIGITAALISGSTVYLAQAGPGLVYLRRGNSLTRLEPTPDATQPLGEGTTEPSLRKLELQNGDLLLAASLSLQEVLSIQDLTELLARTADDALPDLYLRTKDLPAFGLMAITCYDEEPPPEEPAGAFQPDSALPREPRYEPARPQQVGFNLPYENQPWRQPSDRRAGANEPIMVYPEKPKPIDISRPVVNLRNNRPAGRNDYARTTGSDRRFNFDFTDRRLVQIAAIVAVVLILIYFVPGLVKENRSQDLTDFISASQTAFNIAQDETDPAQKRFYLEETRRLANEALRVDETNVTANGLRTQATDALQALDAVFDLSPMTSLLTLSTQITGDVAITGLTVNAGVAYLLDSGGGRIIAVPLDGTAASIVYQDGETYGDSIARAPTEIVWDGNDFDGRLLILDAERKLFELHPGTEPLPVPLRRTSTWASVAAIATYDGNLYVLDPDGNQVHRYLPAAEGFDSEPESILAATAVLTGAVDFVIDGDIYVAFSDGHLMKFTGGQPGDFTLARHRPSAHSRERHCPPRSLQGAVHRRHRQQAHRRRRHGRHLPPPARRQRHDRHLRHRPRPHRRPALRHRRRRAADGAHRAVGHSGIRALGHSGIRAFGHRAIGQSGIRAFGHRAIGH